MNQLTLFLSRIREFIYALIEVFFVTFLKYFGKMVFT